MRKVVRGLVRRPVYAAAVTLVLGVGLGGAYCLYGVVDSVLFRPLAIADADRVVRIFNSDETRSERDNWSRQDVLDQLAPVEAFESVAFYADFARLTYQEGNRQHEWNGAIVSGNYFATMGVNPLAGRLLMEDDAVRGAAPVGVLSAETWRNRFNADEAIIGEAIRINGRPVTVVGVAPPGFSGVSLETRIDVWLPMSLADMALNGFSLDLLYGNNVSWLEAVARLAPGSTAADAQQILDTRLLARPKGEAELTATLVAPAREVAVDPSGDDKQAYREILQALRHDGRVQNAALTLFAPVNDSNLQTNFRAQDYTPAPNEDVNVDLLPVSDGFFRTLGIELLAGKDVEDGVLANVAPVWRAAGVAPMDVLRDE